MGIQFKFSIGRFIAAQKAAILLGGGSVSPMLFADTVGTVFPPNRLCKWMEVKGTNYVAMTYIQSIFQNGQSDFVIATLNIQSINAKFDNLYAIVNNLSASGQYFGAICLQETWLTSDADATLFEIPGYKLMHQDSRCTRHGGLIIFLHEKYCYQVRNLYNSSGIWEGLFIDVTGHNLRKRLTIGNIYRPPHDNNNTTNVETFIDEMSPIIDKLKKENSYAAISGDFNINLLQINEREKYDDFFDMMCSNNFYPKIMLPTRIAKRSYSLLDQIFCKVPCKEQADISASILLSGISDHFPCVLILRYWIRSQGLLDMYIKDQ